MPVTAGCAHDFRFLFHNINKNTQSILMETKVRWRTAPTGGRHRDRADRRLWPIGVLTRFVQKCRVRIRQLPVHPFRMDRAAEAWSAKHPPGASRLEHLPAVRAPPPRPVDRFVPLPGVARLDAVPVLHHGSALAAHQPNAARLHGQVRMRMWRYRAKASRSKSLVAMA